MEVDVLKLTLAEPQGPVSKCFGPFSGTLNLEVSTARLAWVVVVDSEGKELVKGEAFRVK